MEKGRLSQANNGDGCRKPAGGFVFISGTALLNAWWAYRGGIVTLLDLRAWLACFELKARRCRLQRGQVPRYTVRELQALVGSSSEGSVRRSISRLRRSGLLRWSASRVEVGHLPPCSSPDDGDDFTVFLEPVANHDRRIPVPRRIIRMLAKDGNKVVIATVLGHLLRCLYYRNRTCRPTGTCKASWIADTFGVDVRNVKAARKSLIAAGVLRVEQRSQRFLNRHGSLVTFNLAWEAASARCRSLPPPGAESCRVSPPPNKEPELLRMINNQKPPPAVAGACTVKRPLSPPNLRHVVPADLVDPARLAILHDQAREAGYVNGSEADRLKFSAAAQHALAVGRSNPPGLFAMLVRTASWHLITLAEEDRVRDVLAGGARSVAKPPGLGGATTPVRVGELVGRLMSSVMAAGHSAPQPISRRSGIGHGG